MSFYDEQARAKRKTALLIFYFIVAVVLTVICIDFLIIAALTVGRQDYYTYPQYESLVLKREHFIPMVHQVLYYVSPMVIGVILLGTLITSLKLRGGGLAVAKMVNATPIDPDTR